MMRPMFESVEIDISGPDGNAYVIMGIVASCLKQFGMTAFEVNNVLHDMMSGDYEHLLEVASKYVKIKKRKEVEEYEM